MPDARVPGASCLPLVLVLVLVLVPGAGAGACAVVLGAACRVACTVSVYPDWLYPA